MLAWSCLADDGLLFLGMLCACPGLSTCCSPRACVGSPCQCPGSSFVWISRGSSMRTSAMPEGNPLVPWPPFVHLATLANFMLFGRAWDLFGQININLMMELSLLKPGQCPALTVHAADGPHGLQRRHVDVGTVCCQVNIFVINWVCFLMLLEIRSNPHIAC
jgi:hypothetical protein